MAENNMPEKRALPVIGSGIPGHALGYTTDQMRDYASKCVSAATQAMQLTVDDVRAAGGIVHSDGNIFFTNIDKLNKALASKCGSETRESDLEAMRAAVEVLDVICTELKDGDDFSATQIARHAGKAAIAALRERIES